AFQTFGMPFILLSGFFLSGLEASPGQTELVTQSVVLLGIGFAFILAVVPFHTWVPMLTEESNPYSVAYVLFILTGMVSLFGLGFFDRFVWLRDSESAYLLLRLVGSIMVLVSGVWAAVEEDWGRMLGYYIIAETGFSLMAIGMHSPQGILIFFWFIVVRFFSLLFWAGGMSITKERTNGNLNLKSLAGFGHQRPLLVGGALAAQLSIIGTPFLASYPARFALWQQLSMIDAASAGIALIGNIGLLAAGLRVLNTLFIPLSDETRTQGRSLIDIFSPAGKLVSERVSNWLLLGFVMGILVLVGLFPRLFLPWIENFLLMFSQIGS
ncbi:MAG: proton-conducting transporter membrane subunit, partial [Chloroflexota bacterium]